VFIAFFPTFEVINTNKMSPTQQEMIDNLRFFRKEKKLTQAYVAEQSGMLASTYSRLETGQVSPQLQTLERVCDAIGVSVKDLFIPREVKDKSIVQKLGMIEKLSEYNRNVVEIMMDTVIEKDTLQKAQDRKMKNRLTELEKTRKNS